MMTNPVVDADGHVQEPESIWASYLEPKYHEMAPRSVVDTWGRRRTLLAGKLRPYIPSALAEGEPPGERPLGPFGGNDLLAVAVVRGALGLDRHGAVLDGHLDAVRVGAGQVGLDMVTAVLAAVDVHRHPERGTRPGRGHREEPLEGIPEGLEPEY